MNEGHDPRRLLHPAMAEALRLTRAGKLKAAMAALQSGFAAPAPAQSPAPAEPIDLVGRRAPATPPPSKPKPAASRFEARQYHGAEGRIGYWLYVPANARPGMPLVVMLHGCTQNPEDFALGTGMNRLADAHGFLVAYPEQTQSANAQRCWNWFRPGDQQRDRGEPALIAAVTREVIAEQRADESRVYVAGLSAGGAAAAIMGAAYPDLYAAIGVHSGLPSGAARNLPGALSAMKRGGANPPRADQAFVPVITFHGDRDTTVAPVNADQIVAAAIAAARQPLEVRTEQGRSPGGRSYTRTRHVAPGGAVAIEQWTIEGAGHAWSGGDVAGSYTDPSGADASREMLRFFLEHRRRG